MSRRAAIAAGALIALAAALPSRAGLFDDDEARRRIEMLRKELAQQGNDNEARIAKLEELIRNIGVVELVRQLDQMNGEIARLRGSLEVLANEVQFMSSRQVGDDQILHTEPVQQRQAPVAAGRGADADRDLNDLPF